MPASESRDLATDPAINTGTSLFPAGHLLPFFLVTALFFCGAFRTI